MAEAASDARPRPPVLTVVVTPLGALALGLAAAGPSILGWCTGELVPLLADGFRLSDAVWRVRLKAFLLPLFTTFYALCSELPAVAATHAAQAASVYSKRISHDKVVVASAAAASAVVVSLSRASSS